MWFAHGNQFFPDILFYDYRIGMAPGIIYDFLFYKLRNKNIEILTNKLLFNTSPYYPPQTD